MAKTRSREILHPMNATSWSAAQEAYGGSHDQIPMFVPTLPAFCSSNNSTVLELKPRDVLLMQPVGNLLIALKGAVEPYFLMRKHSVDLILNLN